MIFPLGEHKEKRGVWKANNGCVTMYDERLLGLRHLETPAKVAKDGREKASEVNIIGEVSKWCLRV